MTVLTDSLGRKIDFKNTIIMTSNVGARQLKDFGQGVGFGTAATANADDNSKSIIENALKKPSPEILKLMM
jgi:ATP-dependent Clp protease ATP-binding subunit ClpC